MSELDHPVMAKQNTRVYTRAGRLAHLLRFGGSANEGGLSLCGLARSTWDPWLGTGSQDEYDQAQSMPTCFKCTEALTRVVHQCRCGRTFQKGFGLRVHQRTCGVVAERAECAG